MLNYHFAHFHFHYPIEHYAFRIEKSIKEAVSDKISDEEKENVKKAIEALREELNSSDLEKIESKRDELDNIWRPIAERLNASASENQQDGNNPFAGANPFSGFTGDFANNPFAK